MSIQLLNNSGISLWRLCITFVWPRGSQKLSTTAPPTDWNTIWWYFTLIRLCLTLLFNTSMYLFFQQPLGEKVFTAWTDTCLIHFVWKTMKRHLKGILDVFEFENGKMCHSVNCSIHCQLSKKKKYVLKCVFSFNVRFKQGGVYQKRFRQSVSA